MTLVAEGVGATIQKDVVAVRTAEDADLADGVVKKLLGRSLDVETTIQIALLNNKGLQAAFNELALAEADSVEQSLPPNPVFSISRVSGDAAFETSRQVVGDILALATLPFRSDIARERFRAAQFRAILEALRTAAETRRAY
ncbi:TolC family protein, partial [Bradyrhizobium diazoefficiens]|nr:TolC family protein [Bradyrhizobium diazoefficiens]